MARDHTGSRACERCDGRSSHLTSREIEVLLLVAVGEHDDQIAQELGVSVRTIDQHVATMLRRADARDRGELVSWCFGAGILRCPGVWPPTWTGSYCLAIRPVRQAGRQAV